MLRYHSLPSPWPVAGRANAANAGITLPARLTIDSDGRANTGGVARAVQWSLARGEKKKKEDAA